MEQRGVRPSSLGANHGDASSSDSDEGGESESGGGSELQGSSGSEEHGEGGLQGSSPQHGGGGGVVTGPGGVQIRLKHERPDSEGQGVSSRKRRRLGSESRNEDGLGESDQGSDEQGSDECVADLDGDGGEFRGMLGGDSDEEGEGASSFDSRDYDMPAGGGLTRGGNDTAESSGKSLPEKSSSAGNSSNDKTVPRRKDGASKCSSTMATDKEGKQLAGKMHSGKEGKGGEVRVTDEECHQAWPHAIVATFTKCDNNSVAGIEQASIIVTCSLIHPQHTHTLTHLQKASKEDLKSKSKPGGAKRGRDIKALLKGTASGKRLGQRARRALAEKLYGMNARHMQETMVG
eukprot:1159126-Pelagomonas_calceolata.AAC.5